MKRYTFLERKVSDTLPDGRVRIYFDEVADTETVTRRDMDTDEETSETYPVYRYRAADAECLDRNTIIIALIRAEYSDNDELAIQRQKDDKPGEWNRYNAYVEKCKAIALRTLEGDTLSTAKALKIADLGLYDASDTVNEFTVGGEPMWLGPDRRSNLKNAVEALKAQGAETVVFAGQTLPVDTALSMLAAIEGYAALCSLVTEQHRAAIESLESAAAVEAYDFTTGYPQKLEF